MWIHILSGTALTVASWLSYRQLSQRQRLGNLIRMQRARSSQLQEIDELKSRLLTNITHEFRTPLTLIKSQLKRLDVDADDDPRGRIEAAIRHADRLEQLIDQLLDLSRLKAGRLPLQLVNKNVMAFLRVTVLAFESLASNRNIQLETRIPDDGDAVWLDTDVLEKIVGNLLSNAVKYTPPGGTISVWAELGPMNSPAGRAGIEASADAFDDLQTVEVIRPEESGVPTRDLLITVTNTGAYLEPEVREMVFERFYRASTGGGSGVGLALVKELAEWVGGDVGVSSCRERGTCFSVRIPTLLAPPEATRSSEDPSGPVPSALTPAPAGIETILSETGVGSDTKVLVVEDHAEMRQLICEELGGEYQVLEAEDGQQGIELAFAEMPDLVVSDVMMPGIDGFELCRTLKSDQRTSHVPVILLTALSETESRHQGLHDGADAYLAKPFDGEELQLRVRNLIEQRRRLAQRYQNMFPGALPDSMKVLPQSDRFVQHVERVIDDHLEDQEFRINELCREVGLSRSQLHRKLKAVTGRTTSDFVRTHRLHRAAQLLESGYGNVTEVAYAVGFHSLSYFSRSFRDLYGVQPSDYLRRDPKA